MTAEDVLETEVMAHRYLYYVIGRPVISDRDYNRLEQRALEVLPDSSPVVRPGSDVAEHYTPSMVARAAQLSANK